MTLNCYTVFDSVAGAYLQPMWFLNDGMALRSFTDMCMDEEHNFNRHAEDFSLFHIGEFNQVQGEFIPCKFDCLARAHEIVAGRTLTELKEVAG